MELELEKLSQLQPEKKRQLLIEALSYIRGFQKKIVVIKYGGAAMVQDPFKSSFAQDIVLLQSLGMFPVIVHGGGPEVTKAIKQYGLESNFVDGLRVTDQLSLKISEMVLSGTVNKEIVSHINSQDGMGVGLSGKDGRLIQAKKMKHHSFDLGYVGEIEKIDPALILNLIENGYIPVISPIGMGVDGNTYNINADTAASHIGVALNAQKIIFLTDVKGILKGEQLITKVTVSETRELIEDNTISGGMVPKVKGMLHALENGVGSAHIISGMDHHAVISELFTEKGTGTMIIKEN
ncbi:MAG: acetylglutamate kinase [Proteobacteria bacterium]|nr:acetylglutamate kinase [Pseudomonadota bacterium]